MNNIAKEQMINVMDLFELMNKYFFDNKLDFPILNIEEKKGANGYISPFLFSSKDNSLHKIAINPDSFKRSEKEIISTLLHEMCHLWQLMYGKPSNNNYHNKEFHLKMLELGLETYDLDTGSSTGRKVTHRIIQNAKYETFFDNELSKKEWIIIKKNEFEKQTKYYNKSKIKYVCSNCNNKIWGKNNMKIICGDCHIEMEEAD